MSEKNWGDTVVGWFIVKDGEQAHESKSEADLSADELIAKYADQTPLSAEGENAAVEIPATKQIPANYGTPPPAPDGKVDFDAVFDTGGVDADERERIAKAKALLDSLPEGTDVAVKKQIVEASLKAFGVPIEKIIEAGVGGNRSVGILYPKRRKRYGKSFAGRRSADSKLRTGNQKSS